MDGKGKLKGYGGQRTKNISSIRGMRREETSKRKGEKDYTQTVV